MKTKFGHVKSTLALALTAILILALAICVTASEDLSAGLKVAYCNLSFENDTHLVYAIKSDDPNVKLLVWDTFQNDYTLGTQKAIVSPMAKQMTIQGELYTIFKYTGVAAKQMVDDVYVRAYIDSGNGNITYGDVHKYSILQYAYNKLGKTGTTATTDEKLIKMLNEMLAFGAAAQEYHGYKTDRLATADFMQVKLSAGTLPDGFIRGLYLAKEAIVLSAPVKDASGAVFSAWVDELQRPVSTEATFTLTVSDLRNETYTPTYQTATAAVSVGLEFDTNGDGTCYVIGMGTCTDTDVVIPEHSPDNDTVIGVDGFRGEVLTSVTFPGTIEEIARRAFDNCSALTDVYYQGTEAQWNNIAISSGNDPIEAATKHFEAEVTPMVWVIFRDYDGKLLQETAIPAGSTATAPVDPVRDGYNFAGWSKSLENVTQDTVVTALYTGTTPTIAVESVTVVPGENTVTVNISVLNNPGLAGLMLFADYDSAVLTLTKVTYGNIFGEYVTAPEPFTDPQQITFMSPLANVTESGVFATLTFTVSDQVTETIMTQIGITYSQDNTFNIDFDSVVFATESGTVTIER